MYGPSTHARRPAVVGLAYALVLAVFFLGPGATPLAGETNVEVGGVEEGERGGTEARRPAEDEVEPAPPVEPTPPEPAPAVGRYRVRPGDTLWRIARLHALPLARIERANASTALRPGDVVVVPLDARGSLPDHVDRAGAREAVRAAIERWAPEHGLPPALVAALTWNESRWKPGARSHRGAVGVAQVMPATARWVERNLLGERVTLGDVDDNVRVGCAYLRWLIDRAGGDTASALAAYHQGPASIARRGWLPITDRYVRRVFELRWAFAAAGWPDHAASAAP